MRSPGNTNKERERQRGAKDDAARIFDHRRVAYVDFYESLRDMSFSVYNHGLGATLLSAIRADLGIPDP